MQEILSLSITVRAREHYTLWTLNRKRRRNCRRTYRWSLPGSSGVESIGRGWQIALKRYNLRDWRLFETMEIPMWKSLWYEGLLRCGLKWFRKDVEWRKHRDGPGAVDVSMGDFQLHERVSISWWRSIFDHYNMQLKTNMGPTIKA